MLDVKLIHNGRLTCAQEREVIGAFVQRDGKMREYDYKSQNWEWFYDSGEYGEMHFVISRHIYNLADVYCDKCYHMMIFIGYVKTA